MDLLHIRNHHSLFIHSFAHGARKPPIQAPIAEIWRNKESDRDDLNPHDNLDSNPDIRTFSTPSNE